MIEFGIQIPFQIVIIILHLYVFTEDSTDFLIKTNRKEEAMK